MGDLKKYIKIAKDITIKPPDENIEDKILDRISHVSEADEILLDEKFLEYLKKNNSRLYLLTEKIKNNPLRFSLLLMAFLVISSIIVYELKKLYLPSSEDKSQKKKD
jgi:hypothetical protein